MPELAAGVMASIAEYELVIRPDCDIAAVYLHRKPVDMRKQMDGLAAVVTASQLGDALSGSLFVFINKARDKLKILYWERNGYVIWYKRLEEQKFPWPAADEADRVTITSAELNWLLDGYNLFDFKPHRELHYALAS